MMFHVSGQLFQAFSRPFLRASDQLGIYTYFYDELETMHYNYLAVHGYLTLDLGLQELLTHPARHVQVLAL